MLVFFSYFVYSGNKTLQAQRKTILQSWLFLINLLNLLLGIVIRVGFFIFFSPDNYIFVHIFQNNNFSRKKNREGSSLF